MILKSTSSHYKAFEQAIFFFSMYERDYVSTVADVCLCISESIMALITSFDSIS